MRLSISRRLVLGGVAGAVLAGPAVAGGGPATLSVGCWPGAYADALRDVVDARLGQQQQSAPVSVRQVAEPEAARVAGLLAALPGGGGLDVALLSDTDAYRLSLGQSFAPVTTAGVEALPHVLSALRAPYGVPQARTALTIAYNASRLATPPRGFASLFEAARRGEAGFSSELAIHNLAAGAISQHHPQASLDAAKALFSALKQAGTLRLYPTNEALGEALAAGRITMAPMWRSRAYVWRKQGRDIGDSVPLEGAVPFTIMACVPKRSPQAAGAMRYLQALLLEDTQTEMASRLGLLPTVDTARLDRKLLDRIGFSPAQQARFRPLLFSAVARNGLALRQFWDRELV